MTQRQCLYCRNLFCLEHNRGSTRAEVSIKAKFLEFEKLINCSATGVRHVVVGGVSLEALIFAARA